MFAIYKTLIPIHKCWFYLYYNTARAIPPPTPNNAINVSVNYQGEDVFFEWEYADNENVDAHSFHINYSYDNTNFTRVIIDDTSLREYTLSYEYIETGTFYWNFNPDTELNRTKLFLISVPYEIAWNTYSRDAKANQCVGRITDSN